MQVFDGLGAGAHGLLRGIGKQAIGGPANIISYYVISLPISLTLAFGLDWKLEGLWIGVTVGLIVYVPTCPSHYSPFCSYQKLIKEL